MKNANSILMNSNESLVSDRYYDYEPERFLSGNKTVVL